MFTFAFIVNSEGLTPEDYYWNYENEEFKFKFFATSNMEMTKKYAKKLADDGYENIDLCGDFNDDMAKEVAGATDGRINVMYAKYFDNELEKLERLPELGEYGIIINAGGIPEGTTITEKIIGSEFNTTIVLVPDDKMAEAAAQSLVDEGIDFIELCSYFDSQKAEDIINAIKGRVPVGYCGLG